MNLKNNFSSLFVCMACYLTIYSYLPGGGEYVQATSAILVFFGGVALLFFGAVRRIGIQVEEILLLMLSLFSIVVGLLTDNSYSVVYGFVFIAVVIGFMFCARVDYISNTFIFVGWMYILLLASHTLLTYKDFFDALSVSVTETGLVRYSPLGMHPNLVGMIYGGAVVYFGARIICGEIRPLNTILSSVFFSLSLLFILAASARGSLVACFFVLFLGYVIRNGLSKEFFMKILGPIICVGIVFLIIDHNKLFQWASDILELNSDTRGIDSGGTGRTVLWSMGMNLFFSDMTRFFVGGGLRSAEESMIGFHTENSYITIMLELGVFFGGIVLFLFARLLGLLFHDYKFFRLVDKSIGDSLLIIFLMVLFILLQSMFNRYLLAIGNPYSLLIAFLLSGYWSARFVLYNKVGIKF